MNAAGTMPFGREFCMNLKVVPSGWKREYLSE
jgi:hypothetical protein